MQRMATKLFHNYELTRGMCSLKSRRGRADLGGGGGARGAEAPPSRFIATLSKFLLAERGSGKSWSSVSLCLTATVEEGMHRSSSSCKKVR